MREIDEPISQWRENLCQCMPAIEVEVLDEMEVHLRDRIQENVSLGDNVQDAVTKAIAEFGSVEELTGEFEKVPRELLPWWPVQLVVGTLMGSVFLIFAAFVSHVQRSTADFLALSHIATIVVGYASIAAVGVLCVFFLLCRVVNDPLPGQKRMFRWSAKALCLLAIVTMGIGIILGASCLVLSRNPYVYFSNRDLCGLLILALSIYLTIRFHSKQLRGLQKSAVTGLVANIAVFAGAALIHEELFHFTTVFAAGLVLVHCGIAATAFAPPNSLRIVAAGK